MLSDSRGIAGFAIVQGLGDPDGKAHLKRIAVRDPGQGTGEKLLRLLLDWLFTKSATNRTDLDVFVGNARTKRRMKRPDSLRMGSCAIFTASRTAASGTCG
ncbi:MAG: hypothetical protein M3Q08_13255 [Pseudomonadota bacterium]|nr:hypothetical protein [Pseudomonadota bacterium]